MGDGLQIIVKNRAADRKSARAFSMSVKTNTGEADGSIEKARN
jgi:hypothetical protein